MDLVRLESAKSNYDDRAPAPIVFKRRSVSVGNGSGVTSSASGEMFAGTARERLLAEGDRAPVLEVVDHKALTGAAARPTTP